MPLAVTENEALLPTHAAEPTGCDETEGATLIVSTAALLVTELQSLVTTTA